MADPATKKLLQEIANDDSLKNKSACYLSLLFHHLTLAMQPASTVEHLVPNGHPSASPSSYVYSVLARTEVSASTSGIEPLLSP